jgi:hypothetical protein
MRKNIIMNRLKILQKVVEYQSKQYKLIKKFNWEQKQEYVYNQNRIEYLFNLLYFNSFLRQKTKKALSENYIDKTIQEITDIVLIDYDNFIYSFERFIYTDELEVIVKDYIERQFKTIENNTLKLEL